MSAFFRHLRGSAAAKCFGPRSGSASAFTWKSNCRPLNKTQQSLLSYRWTNINTSPHRSRCYATYRGFNNQPVSYWSPYGLNWNRAGKQLGVIGAALVIIYVWNLEEAPVSHRKRFMIVSKSIEKYVGQQGYQETMAEYSRYLLPAHHPDVVRVKRIMKRIIKVSGLDHGDIDWEIHVIDDHKSPPNAFVLPGGKVFVFRSILPICKNDDGLATVLSHETAHQVARHTAENLSKTPIYMLLGMILYTITGSTSFNRLLISGLLQLPASREMESEADYIGLMMMAKACFDPSEASHLWERMTMYEKQMARQVGSAGVPEFLSTHPSSAHRIESIRSWLPEARTQQELAGCFNAGSSLSGFFDLGGSTRGSSFF